MTYGVVAAGAPETARAGIRMFEQGGNAVDAAVAAAFASFVVESSVVNIGGGGYALVAGGGAAPVSYDFFTGTPSLRPESELDFAKILVDFGSTVQPFYIGRGSTAVPGVVAGLCAMASERGTLPLGTLLRPAIDYARHGFVISRHFAYLMTLLGPIFRHTPEISAMYAPNGRLPLEGDRLLLPQLADSMEALAAEGPDLFYGGRFGQKIAADHRVHGGRITQSDLDAYRVEKRDPLHIRYRDCDVLLPPLSSMGGSLIGLALKLLESVPVANMVHNGFEHVRLLAHIMRLANEVRRIWDGLGDGIDRGAHILADNFVAHYRQLLADHLAGNMPIGADPSPPKTPGNTSHISAVDGQGQAVSITTTAGENSGYALGDTGICLNNILGELDLNPNGFHNQPGGRRMQSMMSPTIVMREGRPLLALGSAGSNRIRSAILQCLSNVIDFGMAPQDAIDASRVHHEAGVLELEPGVTPATVRQLSDDGFNTNHWRATNLFFGGAQAVYANEGQVLGGADGRRGAQVLSFP